MRENKLLSICVLILSISIVFGSVWIGNSIMKVNKDTNVNQSSYSLTNIKGLMTEKETAEYLNMSQEKFNSLMISEESQKRKMQAYDTFSFIPFIIIDKVKYYNKEQVDKWIEYNTIKQIEINTSTK